MASFLILIVCRFPHSFYITFISAKDNFVPLFKIFILHLFSPFNYIDQDLKHNVLKYFTV